MVSSSLPKQSSNKLWCSKTALAVGAAAISGGGAVAGTHVEGAGLHVESVDACALSVVLEAGVPSGFPALLEHVVKPSLSLTKCLVDLGESVRSLLQFLS